METVQYISQEAGPGAALFIGSLVFFWIVIKLARKGTLSEDAQRRNHKRDKESK